MNFEKHVSENQRVLRALTDRPWFRRGWVVQEIGTSTPATLFWGDKSIEWDILARVCESMKTHQKLRNTLGLNTSDVAFMSRRFIEPNVDTHHANRFNFVYELQRARHLRFSDDRDRVFAFLGHFSIRTPPPLGCGPVSIKADYTKTVEQTYIDVASNILSMVFLRITVAQRLRQRWIHMHISRTNTIYHHGCLTGDVSEELSSPSQSALIGAHGDSAANLEIIEGVKPTLRIEGVQIDTIVARSRPMMSSDFFRKAASNEKPTMVPQLWRDVCGKRQFNLSESYRNGHTAFFAFMQTLSNGCVQAAGHGRRSYGDIPDRVWLHLAASHVVDNEDVFGDISADIRDLAKNREMETGFENWARWAASASESRTFARSAQGYYVLGPTVLEVGDVICVLFGAKVPFCLRPIGGRYLLVGECCVYGLMKGEAMEMSVRNELRKMRFDII
ncbi:hypothetical protein LQW54_003204 [Pestalotiopsis sp. IQ-011]